MKKKLELPTLQAREEFMLLGHGQKPPRQGLC
jgi:hypothetical protein